MKRLLFIFCLIAVPIRALDYQVVQEIPIVGAQDFVHIDPVITAEGQMEGLVLSDGPGHCLLLYSIIGGQVRIVDLDRWPTYSINYRDDHDTLHVYVIQQNDSWEPRPELVWLRITEDSVLSVRESLPLNLKAFLYLAWYSDIISQKMYFQYSDQGEVSALLLQSCWSWHGYMSIVGFSGGNCSSSWQYSPHLQHLNTFVDASAILQADLTSNLSNEWVSYTNYYSFWNDDGLGSSSGGCLTNVSTHSGDALFTKISDRGHANTIFADGFITSLPRSELIYHGYSEDLLGLRSGNAGHIACYHFGADSIREVWYTPVYDNPDFSFVWKDEQVLVATQDNGGTVKMLDYTTGEFVDSSTLDRTLENCKFFETGSSPTTLNLVGRVHDTIVVYQFGIPTDAPDADESPVVPQKFVLNQNHPNPFNSGTVFEFSIPMAGEVEIKIYNLLGQEVQTVAHGFMARGTHQVVWNGNDSRGSPVASGVYFARMSFGEGIQTIKSILLR